MSTSATTTHLGRHFWASIRDSVTILATRRLPGRQQPPARRVLDQTQFTPQHTQSARSAHWLPWISRAYPLGRAPNNVRRSCTSGGLLLIGFTSSPSSTGSVMTACTAAADSAISVNTVQKATISHLAKQAWLGRSGGRGRPHRVISVRASSSRGKPDGDKNEAPISQQNLEPKQPTADKAREDHVSDIESLANSMSKYLHLPKMPHRPTKEELLGAANGFRERLRVRFKWFSIRSMRPWNADEWGAFVSWFLFGHLVWVLVGTTTFFSLIILFINTVLAQETLARWIGDYLTQSAGLTVVFESAIVPKWKDGVITFRNVFVSRRPGRVRSSVQKGSSNAAAEAAAAAARQADQEAVQVEEDDGNYTQFDVTIDTVNVTLSFIKWWNGKGLLKDVEVKGVRGVVDRTAVHWSADGQDPLSYRHDHSPGDFELDYLKLEDLLVTIYQPGGFRPFSVSIFSCELPQLRKQWLFYDFLSASHMSGSFDGSLFTVHPRQIHGVSASDDRRHEELTTPSAWKKFSRLRIDGLKIDHLNRGVDGPFGWIYEGNVDIVADVMFPADPEEGIGKVVAEFYDKMEEAVTSNRYLKILDNNSDRYRERKGDNFENTNPTLSYAGGFATASDELPPASSSSPTSILGGPATILSNISSPVEEAQSYLVMDLRIHLNDVRAAVPLFNNPHISYVNQALVRPIVAYINAKRTYIPINCRIVKRATDFDGSWTVWDCGLLDDTSAEVYSAFARNVEDQQSRVRRFKRVGLWTVSLVVHALLAGVAGDLM
ncbi:mitochondrial distribution and morphology proteins-domain-containing protein [Lasiosphaeria miniovina]|uniref:Mitochondrial distribution and morphology proteins-domain-containing protein n=1 Tax=Lasiosphaeria miniovina TaxID=1954250 RepID=A0AA40ALG1_9PEZI|nr:mitochondrial distribution and morphology proteins-domain-containing protein [Lasiosphaeria miniovina]KAK0717897.1 mitochondrial distribution and morphology proteins-domain-containing protein [Lasiosphaeria miniovina]